METKEISVEEYINTTLKQDIDYVRKEKPYLAFFLIVSGIEFLGKCMSNLKDWQAEGHSQEDFETAICNLKGLQKYKKYTSELKKKKEGNRYVFDNPPISLYKHARCGLLHAMLIKDKVKLSEGTGEPKEEKGVLTLYLDTFYEDFKVACNNLISNKNYWSGKDKNSTFFTVHYVQEDGKIIPLTANTQTII